MWYESEMSPRRPWFRARTQAGLGRAIRRARQTAGFSQDELAAEATTSRPTLSRLERGASVASKTVLAAAAACGYEIVLVPRGARVTVGPPDAEGAPDGHPEIPALVEQRAEAVRDAA